MYFWKAPRTFNSLVQKMGRCVRLYLELGEAVLIISVNAFRRYELICGGTTQQPESVIIGPNTEQADVQAEGLRVETTDSAPSNTEKTRSNPTKGRAKYHGQLAERDMLHLARFITTASTADGNHGTTSLRTTQSSSSSSRPPIGPVEETGWIGATRGIGRVFTLPTPQTGNEYSAFKKVNHQQVDRCDNHSTSSSISTFSMYATGHSRAYESNIVKTYRVNAAKPDISSGVETKVTSTASASVDDRR